MIIHHAPNDYTDPSTGRTGFLPDWRADNEQHIRLQPGLTLHPLHTTARLFVDDRKPMTLERVALLREFVESDNPA